MVEYSDTTSSSESESEKTPMKEIKRTRKRKRNPQAWKKNQRKEKYQQGQEYVSSKGTTRPAKVIDAGKYCNQNCRFHCREKNNFELRSKIKQSYYSLDQNGKYAFLLNTTNRILVKRKRSSETSYRSFSFEYYFEVGNEKIRVCKVFFLNTLCISQKPIYNVHLKKNDLGTPNSDKRGKNTRDRILEKDKDRIRHHIQSFPYVEAHYCRKDSQKKYLDPTLNLQKMYDLYLDMCNADQVPPQKLSLYRKIFNFEVNLEFLQPKTDRCDICEEYNLARKEKRLTEKRDIAYKSHILKKNSMRKERENDSHNHLTPKRAVICFDLENVINLPKSDVSVLFYKQKLNVYNLTSHCSIGKEVYCAVWPESMCGRSGNDLASALVQMLEKIVSKHPDINEIITWSDSCVPQNRNSLISVAVADFLQRHPCIKTITMKYSIPGHSCIQVVDNIHSRIEKAMRVTDIWSPLSLIKLLLKVDRRKPFCIINMKATQFKNFKKAASLFKYDKIPYTKVCQLRFVQGEVYKVYFKLNDHTFEFVAVDVSAKVTKRGKQNELNITTASNSFLIPSVGNAKPKSFTEKKMEHIEFSFKWMPLEDQQYMKCLLSEFKKK